MFSLEKNVHKQEIWKSLLKQISTFDTYTNLPKEKKQIKNYTLNNGGSLSPDTKSWMLTTHTLEAAAFSTKSCPYLAFRPMGGTESASHIAPS